jgi:predicted molibdopterin-dependent oxidoreductase YjgC
MMIEPRDTVVLLPAQTRYEQRGGGTETTTERRIIFSPEIPGRRIGEARAEWEILMMLGEQARPDRRHLIHFDSADSIRKEIACAVPAYDGIQNLKQAGDQIQWGGPRLCEQTESDGKTRARFGTEDGRARFSRLQLEASESNGAGLLRLSTRRGKQFNTMTHAEVDPLNGARRSDILMNYADAARLRLIDRSPILLRNAIGEMHGYCRIAPIAPGNVQAHWPEANVLIDRRASDHECGIPDYNAVVQIIPVIPVS